MSNQVVSALGRFRRSPGRTLAIVATVIAGVSLSTIGWAIFDSIFVRPFPYSRPSELVKVWNTEERLGFRTLSARDFRILQRTASPLDRPSTYTTSAVDVVEAASAATRRITSATVSSNIFETLGVTTLKGRPFSSEDEQHGRQPSVVVSERLSISELTIAPGHTLILNGRRADVIGVMPKEFWFPDQETNVWLVEPGDTSSWLRPAIARASAGSASDFAERTTHILAREGSATRLAAESYVDSLLTNVKGPLLTVQAGAGALLLLVTVSAGWLLMAATRRQLPEIAIKCALGAPASRVIKENCVEVVLLLALSLGGTIAMTSVGVAWVAGAYADMVPRIGNATLSLTTILIAVAATVLVYLLASLPGLFLIARTAGAVDIRQSLIPWKPRKRESVLMTVYGSLALTLAVGSVLLLLTFRRLVEANVGFANTSIVGVRVELPEHFNMAASAVRVQQVIDSLRSAGVLATVTNAPPLAGYDEFVTAFADYDSKRRGAMVAVRLVDPAFFQIMGLPVSYGRPLSSADDAKAVVVDEDMAQQLWGKADPTGLRVRMGSETWTVVGVSKPVGHRRLLEDAPPAAYVRYSAEAVEAVTLQTRLFILADGQRSRDATLGRVRTALQLNFPEASDVEHWDFAALIKKASGSRPFVTAGATVFAAVAMILLAAAFFGMLADVVTSRTREIGLRLALGSSRVGIARAVGREAAWIYLAASLTASALVWVLARFVDRKIFVPETLEAPNPLLVLAVAFAVVLLVVAATCYWPLRRATRIDPSALLRSS